MLRGLGYSCYIEACGLAPSNIAGALGARAGLFEAGEVRVHPTGTVTVFTGSHSHGQGHETTFAQVVAAKLGIPVDERRDRARRHRARARSAWAPTAAARLSVGGTAIVKAVDKVIAKGKKIAAHLLEAADTDIEFENGEFKVTGTDKKVPFGSVALTAYVPHNYPLDKLEPGLNENAFYDPTNFTYPAGSYICEVEVDPETGQTRSRARFTAVDDFGNIVNPMIVEGQVHGGIAQGLGQAMMEGCVLRPRLGPAAHRLVHGLRDAARRRPAELHGRPHGHAVHAQPARREGLRRGRRDRLAAGVHQRADRRARRSRHGDAGHRRTRLARRQQHGRLN